MQFLPRAPAEPLDGRVVEAKPHRRSYAPLWALVAVNVLAFIPTLFAGAWMNANLGIWWPRVAGGQFWRLGTWMFVHSGFAHLVSNMTALVLLGLVFIRFSSGGRFLFAYLFSGLIGGLLGMLLSGPGTLIVGASGAVFGIAGALPFVIFRRRRVPWWVVAIWLAVLILETLAPGVSWQAHLGGFIGGVIAGLILRFFRNQNLKESPQQNARQTEQF